MTKICGFRKEYFFLSNFYNSPVRIYGLCFLNNEAAFQGQKDTRRTHEFTQLQPNKAKRLGRSVHLRDDWELVKDNIMYDIVLSKFAQNKDLRKKLIDTKDFYLEETNTWGDTYWGICHGKGCNQLGNILMQIRMLCRQSFI